LRDGHRAVFRNMAGFSKAVDERKPDTFYRVLETQKRWKTLEASVKLFFGKSKPVRPVDVLNQSLKAGVSVQRYRISREDGERIKKLERKSPEFALAELLRILGRRES
jgi:hypothetical protein